ncbi:MAG: pentapeptide repeat-containing protein [Planctomycetaceae bacterium]|nr:pentapeptide repeat-containing protein [Planctomycetaceae bacterium]
MDHLNNNDENYENTETQVLETNPRIVKVKPISVEIIPQYSKRFERWTKIYIPFVSAFGMIAVVLIIYWQLRNQSQQMDQQADNTRKQIAAEQFKNAIEHLGSEKQTVVLGGVHALHNLAMTFEEYRKPVFEVLCSFIREETAKEEYHKRVLAVIDFSDATKATPKASIVIQTIVDKLFRYENPDESVYQDHKTKQYYRANLSDAILRGVDLSDANLQRASLLNANLQGAGLYHVNLQSADLRNANLQGTKTSHMKLQDADLSDTNLQGANLYRANLRKATLLNANLRGANLFTVELQEHWPEDNDSHVGQSVFQGTDFRGIQNSNEENTSRYFEDAIKNGTGLKTDLTGIRLYDEKEKELNLDNEQKKAWLSERGANVDDLTAEEVQQLATELGLSIEKDEPQQPDEPTTDEPTTDEPSTDELTPDEPGISEPTTDEVTDEEPSIDESTSEE